jgi:sialidase-1
MRKARPIAMTAITSLAMMTAVVPAASADQSTHRRHGSGLRQINLAAYAMGGYQQYRAPALTVTKQGTVLAAFDGMPNMSDLPSNITVLVRRSTNGGSTWTPAKVVRSAPKPKGFSDPSLLVDRTTGRIFLFYAASVNQGFFGSKTGNDPTDPNILQADYSYSDDDGRTWHPRRITKQIKNPAWGGMFAASGNTRLTDITVSGNMSNLENRGPGQAAADFYRRGDSF